MTSSRLDKAGAIISILCIIHCAAMPLILLFLPALSTVFIQDEGVTHRILFVMVVLVAAFSFIPGYRLHRKPKPLLFFAAGIIGLAVATFLAHDGAVFIESLTHHGHDHDHTDIHAWESVIAIPSSILIVLAHYYNHRSCQHKCSEHHHLDG